MMNFLVFHGKTEIQNKTAPHSVAFARNKQNNSHKKHLKGCHPVGKMIGIYFQKNSPSLLMSTLKLLQIQSYPCFLNF